MNMYKLTQSQYQELLEKKKRLEENRNLDDWDFICYQSNTDGSEFGDNIDYHTVRTFNADKKELEKIEYILKHLEIIEQQDCDIIQIGTTFSAVTDFGDGELDSSDYTLVQDIQGKHCTKDNSTYITPESDFGKAVIGKSLMDGFSYLLNGLEIVGFIEDIEKGKQKVK